MDWKTKALVELRKNALVEAVPGQEDEYLVTVDRGGGEILRTLVRLNEETERYHYMNYHEHALATVGELIDSMSEHLELECI